MLEKIVAGGVEPDSRPSPQLALSLGLLAMMVSGPFLLPFHSYPCPGFWSEWWAGGLGLGAAVTGLTFSRGRSLMLPSVLIVPGILLLNLLFQFAHGSLVFPQIGLLYAAYLLWSGMLMILGRHLVTTVGLVRLGDVIASALALGTLIGAVIALTQWLGVPTGGGWIFPKLGGTVYGNLGQANHHAQYSWLGIASLIYLRGRHFLPRPLMWIAILLIAFGSIPTGSRSVFVYPAVILAAIGWLRFREPDGPAAFLFADVVLLLPVVIALSIFGTWATPHLPELSAWLGLPLPGDSGPVMAGSRLYELVSGTSARLEIARSAWSAFVQHPWLGQGAGNYGWASFVAASSQTGDAPFGVAENAHNFILHLMAEFGAPATGIVILVLGMLAKRFLGGSWGLEQFWCAAVLGIGAVHALLEYPLWYAYFLGPAALMLGAIDSRPCIALPTRRAALYVIVASLAGVAILAVLREDYATIETASYTPLDAHPEREQAWRISMDRLLKLQRESLLSPWALLGLATLAEPSRAQAQHRAALCEWAIRFSPGRWLVARCAMQLAIAGRDQDAKRLTLAALRAFPAQRAAALAELVKGAEEYPEVVPLLQVSFGK